MVNYPVNDYVYPQVDRILLSTSDFRGGKRGKSRKNRKGRKERKSRRIKRKTRGGSSFLADIGNIGGNFISNAQNLGSLYTGKVPEYSSNPTSQPSGSNFPHKQMSSFNY
jgi:hypothetical protein